MAEGCPYLSIVIVTHDHADHTGGLLFLIENDLVKSIVGPPSILSTEKTAKKAWFKAALMASIPIRTVAVGDIIQIGSESMLLVLSPDPKLTQLATAQNENISVVLMLISSGKKFLFMGDAEWDQEKALVLKYGPLLRSSVVKVGHHGSRTSSSASFVRRTVIPDSTISFFSYGTSNRFGHPSPLVLHRWISRKSMVHENGYFRVLQ
jgi:competence protein ComEC